MHFSIAAGTGAASLFSYVPALLGSTIRKRFTEIVDKASKRGITEVFYKTNMQKISQLRIVLRCSNGMSLLFAFACIGFGFYGTRQAMEYELNFSVYAPFFLAEMGIVLSLMSAVAFWASSSTKPDVFKAYQYLVIPYLVGIIVLSVISFLQAYALDSSSFPASVVDEVNTRDIIVAKVKATIIVTGVLEAMTGFFLLQNIVMTKKLFKSLVKSQMAAKWRNQQIANEIGFEVKEEELENLSSRELMVATMSIICGFLYLFFDGSYMMFSEYVSKRDGWITALWRALADIDSRYTSNDPFVISSVYMGALIFGPANFVYAWSLLTRKRYTHVLGLLTSCSVLVTQIFYFSTAMHSSSIHFTGGWGIAVWFCVYSILFRLFWPLWVAVYEAKRAIGVTFEHVDLSMRLKKEEDQIDLSAAQVLFGGEDLTNSMKNPDVETSLKRRPTRQGKL